MKKIYLAGPLGFSEVGREYYNNILIPRIKKLGYQVLDPWSANASEELEEVLNMESSKVRDEKLRKLNFGIGKTNEELIFDSDLVLACLDGTDVDSGTASEIGYAKALGKQIFGYRGDFRLSSENTGSKVNIQVEYFIISSGGEIFSLFEDVLGKLEEIILNS